MKFLKYVDQTGDDLSILSHRNRLPMYRNFKSNEYFRFRAKYAQYVIDTPTQYVNIQHKAILVMSLLQTNFFEGSVATKTTQK